MAKKQQQRPYRLRERNPDKMPSDPSPAEIAAACEVLRKAHLAELKRRPAPAGTMDGAIREYSERELRGE